MVGKGGLPKLPVSIARPKLAVLDGNLASRLVDLLDQAVAQWRRPGSNRLGRGVMVMLGVGGQADGEEERENQAHVSYFHGRRPALSIAAVDRHLTSKLQLCNLRAPTSCEMPRIIQSQMHRITETHGHENPVEADPGPSKSGFSQARCQCALTITKM